ncbi:hypothetical protein N781_06560 [Pontibacillus halophilus JSM 076056 = DSM 19796]|uniref:PRC-barrel domain-containing protein n=1 Tax=Pontibacillus halophilus JSM 076056 = DSM 19796 TaxID=1385510 RepID=A0A0A5GHQ4_9BACI|nr:PRC-barrel domain-containing protein [Pontibacillus halophilus]KGX90758.1 hypothetical protein N781_06560 [Pontibacillus halophilus JSM 076056 = DSM 19796]
MLHLASDLEHYHLQASDGEIGNVQDLYFDWTHWTVRYVVVDTRKWLPGKKVILSPYVFHTVVQEEETLYMTKSKGSIQELPSVEAQIKSTDSDDVSYAPYDHARFHRDEQDGWNRNNRMQSVNELSFDSFPFYTEEGERVGTITDVLIENKTWDIRYLVVRTESTFQQSYILVSPEWLFQREMEEMGVFYLNMNKETLEKVPSYDGESNVPRSYEEQLYNACHMPKYWQ